MSYITEAVIWVRYGDEKALEAIRQPLPFDGARGQQFGQLDVEAAGGSKFFCSDVFAAAFNYVLGDALEGWFRALPWGKYDDAFLSWETEGDARGWVSIDPPSDSHPGWH